MTSPQYTLTDQSDIFTSEEFVSYIKNKNNSNIIYTDTYNLQGSKIPENSFKCLEYIIKTVAKDNEEMFYYRIILDAFHFQNNSSYVWGFRKPTILSNFRSSGFSTIFIRKHNKDTR